MVEGHDRQKGLQERKKEPWKVQTFTKMDLYKGHSLRERTLPRVGVLEEEFRYLKALERLCRGLLAGLQECLDNCTGGSVSFLLRHSIGMLYCVT